MTLISDYRTIKDLKIGVLGYGDIGKELCKNLKYFGAQVYAYKKTFLEEILVDKIIYDENFDDILDVDYLINTLPSTPQTKFLLTKEIWSKLKKPCVFINVGRGNISREEDLVEALKKNYVSKAILDVFEKEPLDPSSELWTLKNVIITPHVSARTFAQDISQLFLDNLNLFQQGKELLYKVDFNKGY